MGVMTDPTAVGAIPISELIEHDVRRVRPDVSLVEVAEALTEADVGVVVVGEDEKVSGIVSERDLSRAIAGGRDLATTHAQDVAHTQLVWCDATATVSEVAVEMMEQYVRHVLVEEGGRLVGIVSARDLLGVYASSDLGIS